MRTKICLALLALVALTFGTASAANIIVNPGFEDGRLDPWYQDREFGGTQDWDADTIDFHSGKWSAYDVGNYELRQDFAPIATDSITEVSFWAKHVYEVPGDEGLAYTFFYTDDSYYQGVVDVYPQDGWVFNDVTSRLESGKMLEAFSVFGNSSGQTYTFVDDFMIDGNVVPEPATFALFGLGALGVGLVIRRRRR